MKKFTVAAALAAAAMGSTALAQTRSSFQSTEAMTGITVTNISGLKYNVAISANPTLKIGATIYNVTDIFGFWALSNDIDLNGTTASFAQWSAHASNSGTGGIVGWKTNPNTGITPGGNQDFTFTTLATGDVDNFGFHIRVSGTLADGGNTAYFTYVPAPGSAALAGMGALLGARRRRR